MDNSSEYIEMCEKAQEIQELRKQLVSLEYGDCLFVTYNNSYSEVEFIGKEFDLKKVDNKIFNTEYINCEDEFDEELTSIIWLPRQDQLQEMPYLIDESLFDYHYTFTNFVSWYSFGTINFELFETFDQLWLAFIMKIKYYKTWNNLTKEWGIE